MGKAALQAFKNKIKICVECKKEFIPASHGGTKQFCSYRCSNTHKWKTRERRTRPVLLKTCRECGKEYEKHPKMSLPQWNENKFCSIKCSAEHQKIKDGLTTHERSRRKRGQLIKGTPDWLEMIKARTKEGMNKPEVRAKIMQPRQPMSYENRIIRSEALAGKMPQNLLLGNGMYSNVQRGDYECSKGTVYFRSKWEANYALFLDFLIKQGEIKDWEFESEVFMFEAIKLGTRSYRPDFKVFNNDDTVEYHEVKGHMDSRSKTKLKRMAKYFPEIKLVLIDRTYYMDMYKKMKNVLKLY